MIVTREGRVQRGEEPDQLDDLGFWVRALWGMRLSRRFTFVACDS